MALQNYEAAKKKFPPAYVVDSEGKPLYSWRVLILPFIEEGNMYREFHLDEPWDSPHNLQFLEHCPSYFQCPASNLSREKGETTYAMIVGPDAVSNGSESVGMDFIASTPQGASGTLLITESRIPVPWTAPYDIPLESLRDGISPRVAPSKDKQGVGAPHNSNAVAAFVDGSVRYLDPSTTTPEQLWKLATIGTSEEKPSP